MIKKTLINTLVILVILTGCAENNDIQLPAPSEIYAVIDETIELPDMVELPEELFIYSYGIELDWFDSAIAYTCLNALQPDEIVIIHAVDENAANDVLEKLNARLAYKKKSAEKYLPETAPILNSGIVRQDGLTVSLLVTSEITAIQNIYKNMK